MDKHVLFLGAGASIDAGYPLTNNLLTRTKEYIEQYRRDEFAQALEKIRDENINTHYLDFLIERDVELFFTFLDILRKIRIIKEEDTDNRISRLPNSMTEEELDQAVNRIYDESGINEIERMEANFKQVKLATEEMLYCLFENSCHNNEIFPYIEKMTSTVNAIITTNWDALPEKSLFKRNLWSPVDGYGFKVEAQDFWGNCKQQKSQIKILKLHGGIAWRIISNEITLAREFLHWLTDGELSDRKAYLGNNDVYMQFPSFAKELIHPEVINVWGQAENLLHKCNKLTVVGYSLPDSDTNIRALFLPIRRKIKRGKFDLKIIIGETGNIAEIKQKWINFLQCSEENIICEDAADYFNKRSS